MTTEIQDLIKQWNDTVEYSYGSMESDHESRLPKLVEALEEMVKTTVAKVCFDSEPTNNVSYDDGFVDAGYEILKAFGLDAR